MCGRTLGGTPEPVSLTVRRTKWPGVNPASGATSSGPMLSFAVAMRSRPPCGMASRAFAARFMSTCSICPGSATTSPSDASVSRCSSISSPTSFTSRPLKLAMTSLRFSRRGCRICLRLKARSCRRQARGAARGALDLLRVGPPLVGRIHRIEQQIDVSEDRGEHVVEVVRDAAGEAADRLHLERLPKLLLERSLFSDVPADRDHHGLAAHLNCGIGEFHQDADCWACGS